MNEPDATDEAISTAYQAGQSLRSIAEDHNTSHHTIRRILHRLGVELRPAGRPLVSSPRPAPTGWFNPAALRTERERRHLSRSDLSTRVGISPRTIERLENPFDHGGKSRNLRPSVTVLHGLADALGIDASALMQGTKNLRWSRIAAGYDATSFAEALNISQQKLSDIERGKQQLPVELHDRACELLGITAETLTRRLRY